jgi:hypothetical protein
MARLVTAQEPGDERKYLRPAHLGSNTQVKQAIIRTALRCHQKAASHAPPVHHTDQKRGLDKHLAFELDLQSGGMEIQENGFQCCHDV